jgi:hypothetical protein
LSPTSLAAAGYLPELPETDYMEFVINIQMINIQIDMVVIWLRTSTDWPITHPWRFCALQWKSVG